MGKVLSIGASTLVVPADPYKGYILNGRIDGQLRASTVPFPDIPSSTLTPLVFNIRLGQQESSSPLPMCYHDLCDKYALSYDEWRGIGSSSHLTRQQNGSAS